MSNNSNGINVDLSGENIYSETYGSRKFKYNDGNQDRYFYSSISADKISNLKIIGAMLPNIVFSIVLFPIGTMMLLFGFPIIILGVATIALAIISLAGPISSANKLKEITRTYKVVELTQETMVTNNAVNLAEFAVDLIKDPHSRCLNCGQKVNEQDGYCKFCGTKLARKNS